MEICTLLDLAADLGYELAMSGAETFRVEESISRVLGAYGVEAEVFAIPNCLTVSILTGDGQPITRMRRIGHHGNDLDAVEKLSGLSRAICNRKPDTLRGYVHSPFGPAELFHGRSVPGQLSGRGRIRGLLRRESDGRTLRWALRYAGVPCQQDSG